MTFVISQGELLPSYQRTLLNEDGDPVNLTTIDAVFLRVRQVGSSTDLFQKPAEIVDAAQGLVKYIWDDGDTDISGQFEAQFLTQTGSRFLAYPNGSYELLTVYADDMALGSELVFCTAAEARTILRTDLDVDDLALAQMIISMKTGMEATTSVDPETPTDYDNLDDQDKLGLRRATAIQARWMRSQPDYFERMSLLSEAADGASYQYTLESILISPLVAWALNNTHFQTSGDSTIETPRANIFDAVQIRGVSYSKFDLPQMWERW